MLGHVAVNVPDLEVARAYYDQIMPALDFEPFLVEDDQFAYWPAGGKPGTFLFFYPSAAGGASYARDATGLQHLAFMVPTRSRVREVRALVERLGSEVLFEPREFPEYPPPYYATFWLDPHGFMLEAVCHHDRE